MRLAPITDDRENRRAARHAVMIGQWTLLAVLGAVWVCVAVWQ